jgi:hypothetical protein
MLEPPGRTETPGMGSYEVEVATARITGVVKDALNISSRISDRPTDLLHEIDSSQPDYLWSELRQKTNA